MRVAYGLLGVGLEMGLALAGLATLLESAHPGQGGAVVVPIEAPQPGRG